MSKIYFTAALLCCFSWPGHVLGQASSTAATMHELPDVDFHAKIKTKLPSLLDSFPPTIDQPFVDKKKKAVDDVIQNTIKLLGTEHHIVDSQSTPKKQLDLAIEATLILSLKEKTCLMLTTSFVQIDAANGNPAIPAVGAAATITNNVCKVNAKQPTETVDPVVAWIRGHHARNPSDGLGLTSDQLTSLTRDQALQFATLLAMKEHFTVVLPDATPQASDLKTEKNNKAKAFTQSMLDAMASLLLKQRIVADRYPFPTTVNAVN